MPYDVGYSQTLNINGVSYTQSGSTTGNVLGSAKPSVPAAKAGTLTARTDNDTATLTMASGHGIISTNKVDVHWNGGSRRDMTATVTGDSVAVDGGAGDPLPAVDTVVAVMKPTKVTGLNIVGDDIDGLASRCARSGWVVYLDDADTVLLAHQILPNRGGAQLWSSQSGATNPLATKTVASVLFSHDDTSQAQEMEAVAVS